MKELGIKLAVLDELLLTTIAILNQAKRPSILKEIEKVLLDAGYYKEITQRLRQQLYERMTNLKKLKLVTTKMVKLELERKGGPAPVSYFATKEGFKFLRAMQTSRIVVSRAGQPTEQQQRRDTNL